MHENGLYFDCIHPSPTNITRESRRIFSFLPCWRMIAWDKNGVYLGDCTLHGVWFCLGQAFSPILIPCFCFHASILRKSALHIEEQVFVSPKRLFPPRSGLSFPLVSSVYLLDVWFSSCANFIRASRQQSISCGLLGRIPTSLTRDGPGWLTSEVPFFWPMHLLFYACLYKAFDRGWKGAFAICLLPLVGAPSKLRRV
jgi:hypothetical protein